ncbi:hypothetical protein SDRG_15123 [Saprolegnia diclina VS20]|uniref:F-box domain-containing protein n=1 Tax=Saprolegnia diclina (strain VS20) TaxID=1156394 RepID=T0Q173_SAPDV|nr:hypothetical protein SDRG_15123 [Saprolegnia diclina VS20]EQC27115.1 hypothetical protein SDRG_15123 [Saprolegnia diclina VS20]|eukprot:XP_008619509.1 hypothetical protein SDRG_15123 [Saprolegnia diclina VS20]
MSMTKRPCAAPISVGHAGVLVHIAQCLDSTKDVLSLLQALPRDALDAPLTALRTLLLTPGALDDSHWPQVCIEDIDGQYTSTVLTALPAFSSISVDNLDRLNGVLGTIYPATAIIHFAAKWGYKITSIRVSSNVHHMDVFGRMLVHCNNLSSIRTEVHTWDAPFAAAIACAAQSVTRIEITAAYNNAFASESWLPILTAWLASGRAQHLGLRCLDFNHDTSLGRAIAAASSLTSLSLLGVDGVVRGLLDANVPLPNITKLRLETDSGHIDVRLLSNVISLSTLCALELIGNDTSDYTFVLALLPRMLMLRDLTLQKCTLHAMPNAIDAPRHLRALSLNQCTIDGAGWDLLAWASQSPCFQSVSLSHAEDLLATPLRFGRCLRQWMAAGVERLVLDGTEVDHIMGAVIAMTLCDTHRRRPFELCLDSNNLDYAAADLLIEALTTCTGVILKFMNHSVYQDSCKLQAVAAELQLRAVYNVPELRIFSPS